MRRAAVVLGAGTAVLVLLCAVLWWTAARDEPPVRAVASPDAGCLVVGGAPNPVCERWRREMAERQIVTGGGETAARRSQEAFLASAGGRTCRPDTCDAMFGDLLVAAGFTEPAARSARGDDPAPPGHWVFAGRAGTACLVGGWNPELGAGWTDVTGVLPDGSCLGP